MPQVCFNCMMGATLVETYRNLKKKKALDQEAAEQTAPATVLSRRVDSVRAITKISSSWIYLVTFRMENGDQMELEVPEDSFSTFLEGLSVEITWRDKQLLQFTCTTNDK